MHRVLFFNMSADGKIAGSAGQTPWSDAGWESYDNFVKNCNSILMDEPTFISLRKDGSEDFGGDTKFYIVTNQELISPAPNVHPVSNAKAVTSLNDDSTLGIVCGPKLASELISGGLVEEIIIEIEPILLGQGLDMFSDIKNFIGLKLLETTATSANAIRLRYEVEKA